MERPHRITQRRGAGPEGRLAILKAARRLFADRGFLGVSIDDVAREATVSKGLVLYHFASKDRLFAHIIGELKEELFLRLKLALEGQTSAMDKLMALIKGYLHLVKSQRKLWRIVLHEAYSLGGATRKLLVECRQSNLSIISNVLEEGMDRGELRNLDPQLASLCLLGIISERVLATPTPTHEPDVEQLASSIADIMLNGVGAPRRMASPALR
ncbi:MAG: TetR/AcrR family transcriptional regulator [Dehalococcoidia bacterium]|jgi:TetR/AcrR family fatty acid metabolism transcriptional regulator|nr:TetR/AcrR family transcriptional regulator [Dehalococcoidia bacterium]